jgi:PhnB protein
MQITPYINFNGRAEEAAHFYKSALGAELQMLMRFSESPEPQPPGMVPPGSEHKVMHMSLKVGDAVLMGSDGGCTGAASFQGVSMALSADTDAESQRLFAALAEGGQVQMPLTKTFFSSQFGMVADRFGLQWMVMTAQQQP